MHPQLDARDDAEHGMLWLGCKRDVLCTVDNAAEGK